MQPVDRIWEVVSDPEKGTLLVYNEKNELILRQKRIDQRRSIIYRGEFPPDIATNLNTDKVEPASNTEVARPVREFNYMYAWIFRKEV